jgi:hypothetical protein
MGTKKGQRRKTARRAYYKPSRKKLGNPAKLKRDKWGDAQIKEKGKLFTFTPTMYSDERYVGTAAKEMRQQGWLVRTRQYAPGAFAIFRRKK